MWISTLELELPRVVPTQLLGRFWRGAYFSSIAPLKVQNVPRRPLPASNWVRVRNQLAGICGSDLHLIYTDGDFRIAPAALPRHDQTFLGHEVVGEVIEVGDDVEHLRVGDRVVLQHGPNCFSTGIQPLCRSCATGHYNLCEHAELPGPQPFGGGWSEEMLLHEQQLYAVPSTMTNDQAVMLEPASVVVHAVLRCLPLPGDHVLIIGAGTIGLLLLQAVRALAPDAEISVLARHAFQVEQATRLGASHIIYPQESYKEIERATGAKLYQGLLNNQMLLGGYDVIFDTVGTKRTIHDSLRWARAGGTVVMVGLSLHVMQLDLSPIWYQEINLIGTLSHGMESWPGNLTEVVKEPHTLHEEPPVQRRSTFSIAAELMEQGHIQAEPLITHRFALNDYRQALTTASSKGQTHAIKVVFDYSLQPAMIVPNIRASARRPITASATTQKDESTRNG